MRITQREYLVILQRLESATVSADGLYDLAAQQDQKLAAAYVHENHGHIAAIQTILTMARRKASGSLMPGKIGQREKWE
jgi:hypothetical protein